MKDLFAGIKVVVILIALYMLWGCYVRDMHKFEPDNFNWPDEIFGIRPK